MSCVQAAHADPDFPSWNEVNWRAPKVISRLSDTAATLDDDLNGTVELDIDGIARRFEIAPPSGPGDGTVPVESGEAPRPHVVQSFRHRGRLAGHQPYEHQSAFEAREPLGCTLYAIARIAATSPWFQAQLAEIQGTHQDAP